MKTKFLVIAALQLAFLSTAHAGSVAPDTVVGKFGFDWLNPKNAKCTTIDAKTKFKVCAYYAVPEDAASFTGRADFYKCQAGPKSEYMIYKTKDRCAEELGTMQANGD